MYQSQMPWETDIPLLPSSYHLFVSCLPHVLIPRFLHLSGEKHFPWEVDRKVGNQLGVGGDLAFLWEGALWPGVSCYGTESALPRSSTKEEPPLPHPADSGRCWLPLLKVGNWLLQLKSRVLSTTALKGTWPFKSWSLLSVREHERAPERESLAAWEDATGRALKESQVAPGMGGLPFFLPPPPPSVSPGHLNDCSLRSGV